MFYVTYRMQQAITAQQINIFDALYGNLPIQLDERINQTRYITTRVENPRPIPMLQGSLTNLLRVIKTMTNDNPNQYEHFRIPKATHGFRDIYAPAGNLKTAQRLIVNWMQTTCKTLPNNAAHAYVPERSALTACKVHQANESKWMLKIDLKDFFPSCTGDFVFSQLKKIYPYCLLSDDSLRELLRFCLLNDALPQGAPTSPIITNTIMIPYDYAIQKKLMSFDGVHYVYTRYADDLLISSKIKFNYNEVVRYLEELLPDNLKIKHEKTRFGSTSGQNWNLGLMLNKDNNITLGYKEKQRLRAMVNSLLKDYTNDIKWSAEDRHHAQGKLAYLRYIEPEYHDGMTAKYEQKYGVSIKDALK